MKEKSQIEKKAEEKQITLLSTALSEASNAGGHCGSTHRERDTHASIQGVFLSAHSMRCL